MSVPQLSIEEANKVIKRLVTLLNKQFWEEDTMVEWRDLLTKERDVIFTDAMGAADEAARRFDTITFRAFRELLQDQRRQRVTLGANTLEGGGRPTPADELPHRMAATRVVAAGVRLGEVEASETACRRAFDAVKDLSLDELRRIALDLEQGFGKATMFPEWKGKSR